MGVKIRDKITPEGAKLKQTLRELAKLQVRIGFEHGKATEENGADVCDVAAWNELGTVHMPSRPFLRSSVDDNMGEITSFLKSQNDSIVGGASAEQVLKEIGIFQKDLIQEKIGSGGFAPNAPSTVRQKGSSTPLIDTGRMRQSVDYVIKPKGGD